MSTCKSIEVCTDMGDDRPFIVLYGIPWDQYVRMTDVLGEYHLRHTYVEGTLEMRSLLYGVNWDDYLAFLDALGDRHLRHTYDRGTLEMMSPLKEHDWVKRPIGRMIETMCFEFGIEIQSVGSTTLTSNRLEKGLQPDESYYVQHEPDVRYKSHYDPDLDPPPDIAIEVDVTSKCLPRLPVFSGLKIHEVWRYDGNRLHILIRSTSGKRRHYREASRSKAFPFLTATDITGVLDLREHMTENALIGEFIARAKELRTKHMSQTKRKRKR